MSDAWREHVLRWIAIGEGAARPARRRPTCPSSTCSTRPSSAPGRSARERLDGFLVKALREAKRNTSWQSPDEAWEHEVLEFSPPAARQHGVSSPIFEPFAARVTAAGER